MPDRAARAPTVAGHAPCLPPPSRVVTVTVSGRSWAESRPSPYHVFTVLPAAFCTCRSQDRCQTLRPATMGTKLIPPYANFAGKAHCPSLAQYEEMYQRSIEDPDGFLGRDRRHLRVAEEVGQGSGLQLRRQRLHQVVHQRQDEHLGQRVGSPPGEARQPGGHHLGRQLARRTAAS